MSYHSRIKAVAWTILGGLLVSLLLPVAILLGRRAAWASLALASSLSICGLALLLSGERDVVSALLLVTAGGIAWLRGRGMEDEKTDPPTGGAK